MPCITIASICPLMTPAEPRANLNRLHDWTRKAAAAKADLALFPEMFVTGYIGICDAAPKPSTAQQHAFRDLAEPIPGPTTGLLEDEAKSASIHVCAGLLEREGDVLYNTQVLVCPDRGLLGAYRKVQVGHSEAWYSSPGDRFPVFDVKGVPAGILICRDKSFPEIARILALEGAKLLLNPHAAVENDRRLFRDWSRRLCAARAMENGCYLIANNSICTESVAPDRHAGYSFALDPYGRVVHCDEDPGDAVKMSLIEVDTDVVDRRRAEEGVHFNLWSRNPSAYARLVDPRSPPAPDTGGSAAPSMDASS